MALIFRERLAREYGVPVEAVDDAFLHRKAEEVEQDVEAPDVLSFLGGHSYDGGFREPTAPRDFAADRAYVEQQLAARERAR